MPDFIKSKGTNIYLVDPEAPTALITMACPTSVSESGGTRNLTEILCLDSDDPYIVAGSRTARTYTIPFALAKEEASHQVLFELEELGESVPVLIALSDGTTDPTVVDGAIVPPAGRTSFGVNAIIEGVTIDIAGEDVVRGTLTLRVNGPRTITWAS